MQQKVVDFLTTIPENILVRLPELISSEWTRRLEAELEVGDRIVTLQAGFSGLAGVQAYFLGYTEDRVYAKFGSNLKDARWLLRPHEFGTHIRIIKKVNT